MRQPRALLPLLCLLAPAGARAEPAAPSPLPPAACLDRLDAAVRRAEEGDEGGATRALDALAPRCEHLPQIHHDLGVLAARDDRTPEAVAHLETALATERRAGETLEALRALHRREAAIAYARALGTSPDVPSPRLALQDSSDVGADTLRAGLDADPSLRRVETLEYELYAWWRSAAEDASARLAHYADGYPSEAALAGRERDALVDWDDVRREIAFTAEDAVAVLAQPGETIGGEALRRLLLLRLEGDRWKIYRETPL